MVTVIIAGGSGTRLWPLSTSEYPKHLLKVNGDQKSLVQNTYERIKVISSDIFVITEVSHADIVKEQLPQIKEENFIIEPARRGTASCIVAGLAQISRTVDPNEPIAFVAADHYVRDIQGFKHSFKVAENISKKEGRIVLVGVEPDHAATGFGYIQKGEQFSSSDYVFNVTAFKEKPDFKTAQRYVSSGNYLWNCGYFVGSINTFLHTMERYAPALKDSYETLLNAKNQDAYQKTYLSFPNEAIDYALIERVGSLLVVPASFDWMDLGSFADLYKAAEKDDNQNHIKGNHIELAQTSKCFIENLDDRPVAVIGLDNIVVINSPNGVLVVRKDLSQSVGDVAKIIQAQQQKGKI